MATTKTELGLELMDSEKNMVVTPLKNERMDRTPKMEGFFFKLENLLFKDLLVEKTWIAGRKSYPKDVVFLKVFRWYKKGWIPTYPKKPTQSSPATWNIFKDHIPQPMKLRHELGGGGNINQGSQRRNFGLVVGRESSNRNLWSFFQGFFRKNKGIV